MAKSRDRGAHARPLLCRMCPANSKPSCPTGVLLLLLSIGTVGLAQTPAAFAQARPAVAIVDGRQIYEEDVLREAPALHRLRKEEFDLKLSAIDALINRHLVEAQAKQRGITVDVLLEQEVDQSIPEPSEDELKAYYGQLRNQMTQPFEAVRPQLLQLETGIT